VAEPEEYGNEVPGRTGGVVRRLDQLGRVVVPAEARRALGIRHGDLIETRLENGRVVIVKYEPACVLCGGDKNLVEMHDKRVCNDCVRALVEKTSLALIDDAGARVYEELIHAGAALSR
jgi:transcriptional pleiotropic regulator of transition state genes